VVSAGTAGSADWPSLEHACRLRRDSSWFRTAVQRRRIRRDSSGFRSRCRNSASRCSCTSACVCSPSHRCSRRRARFS